MRGKLAAHLLTEANEVRILGFSFPETDGYIKYLLSLGAMRAPHLKQRAPHLKQLDVLFYSRELNSAVTVDDALHGNGGRRGVLPDELVDAVARERPAGPAGLGRLEQGCVPVAAVPGARPRRGGVRDRPRYKPSSACDPRRTRRRVSAPDFW